MSTGTLVAGPLPKIGRKGTGTNLCPRSNLNPQTRVSIMPSLRHWLKPSGFRHIGVVNENMCSFSDGMKMFGALDLEGCRVSMGMAFETLTTNHDLIDRKRGAGLQHKEEEPCFKN